MEANNKKLDIISRELIKPSSPTALDRKELQLSFLDQLMPPVFFSLLFFYQNKHPDHSRIDLVQASETILRLKQSLSECLTKFYPLAGRLNPDHLSVDCDDSGVLFVEAKVDAPLSEALRDTQLENFGQYLPFDPYTNGSEESDDKPNGILFVQITWFGCGGSAVGVRIHHKVADLMSLVTFMNSWAATNRRTAETESSTKSLLMMKEPNFHLGRHTFPRQVGHEPSFPSPPTVEKGKLVCKRFVFNQEKLKELKELATSSSGLKDPTRVEVVTANLWKHLISVARAQNQDDTNRTMFRLMHGVNLRNRVSSLGLSSSDHEFAFGNLVIGAQASFTSESDDDADYGDLVWLTSDAMRKVNEDYVFNFAIPLLKSLGGGTDDVELPTTMVTRDSMFSSWCRYPLYEVDFGWGKPSSVGPVINLSVKVVILASTPSEDGIEAWVCLSEDELALLPEELLSVQATNLFHLD